MKLRDKLKYLSNRALAAGIIISALLALFACILILLANKEQAPWWCVGLFTAVVVLFPVTCWFWLVRPYFRCEQMMNRFLEGYLFSEPDTCHQTADADGRSNLAFSTVHGSE